MGPTAVDAFALLLAGMPERPWHLKHSIGCSWHMLRASTFHCILESKQNRDGELKEHEPHGGCQCMAREKAPHAS